MTAKRIQKQLLSRWNIVEAVILTAVVIGLLAAGSILIYQRWTSKGPFRREYRGKIIDKRISVFESNEGSSFANELIVEEGDGHRFTVRVTQEIYDRAKPGMWIQKTAGGTQLLPGPEHSSSGE